MGKPIPGIQAAIVDDQGNELPPPTGTKMATSGSRDVSMMSSIHPANGLGRLMWKASLLNIQLWRRLRDRQT
jgi:acyl-coenzyme A synthetase/AMP-(fatty) acid ligase